MFTLQCSPLFYVEQISLVMLSIIICKTVDIIFISSTLLIGFDGHGLFYTLLVSFRGLFKNKNIGKHPNINV